MLKSILTATLTAQATNNTMVLPISFTYDEARLFGLVTVNKVDAAPMMKLIQRELGVTTSLNDEDFYNRVKTVVAGEHKFRFPIKFMTVILRESGAILMLNWGGTVFLRRNQKTGQLTKSNQTDALEVRAGKLKEGDILALLNEQDPQALDRVKEDLDSALDWTDFAVYGQAYLSQPDQENLGLVVIKWRETTAVEMVEKTSVEITETINDQTTQVRVETEVEPVMERQPVEVEGVTGIHQLDAQRVGQVVADERKQNRWSAFHQNSYIQPQPNQFEQSRDYAQAPAVDQMGQPMAPANYNMPAAAPMNDEYEDDEEEQLTPWEKISGFFKKKISK